MEQSKNALSPIFVTLEGIVSDDKEEQPKNAPSPILVTPEGIVSDDKEEQPENALFPIPVTPGGIAQSCLPGGQRTRVFRSFVKSAPLLEQYSGLFLSTSSVVKEEHFSKTPVPIPVTPEGSVSDDKEEQPSKAQSSILVTLLRITSDDKEEQYQKA